MSAIDFSLPTKTQNYDTGFLSTLRSQQLALASFLDGAAITTNTAGIKRYNATSQLFEKSDGAAWTEMPLGYLKLGGGTLAGALQLAGDATAALNPVSLQQMNAALAGKVNNATLGAYMPLAGGNFSGNIGAPAIFATGIALQGQNIIANGTLQINGSLATVQGSGVALLALIDTSGGTDSKRWQVQATSSAFAITATNDANTVATAALLIARTTYNVASITLSGNTTLNGTFDVSNDLGGGYGGQLSLTNVSTGASPYLRVNPSNDIEIVSASHSAINATVHDADGSFTTRGLMFGRGGGAGIGQWSVQSGGSPSGGADGDVLLVI